MRGSPNWIDHRAWSLPAVLLIAAVAGNFAPPSALGQASGTGPAQVVQSPVARTSSEADVIVAPIKRVRPAVSQLATATSKSVAPKSARPGARSSKTAALDKSHRSTLGRGRR